MTVVCTVCRPNDGRRVMEHRRGANVDYSNCYPVVIKPTSSFYENYRRPFAHDQLISRESYAARQVPVVAHQRHGSPYHHHSYHRHQQQQGRGGRGDVISYDDVMESRSSFTELQPVSRAPARSVVVQSLGGSIEWASTPPPISHSHQRKYTRFV